MEVQHSLLGATAQDTEQLHALSQRTEVLFQFRKQNPQSLLRAGPSAIPARSSRATIAATSPLIYFVLNQLVQIYLFPFFGLK